MKNEQVIAGMFCTGVGIALGYIIAKILEPSNENNGQAEDSSKEILTKIKYIIDYEEEFDPINDSIEKEEGEQNEQLTLFPLKEGSNGEEVNRLQVFLMRKMGWIRKPTGFFDEITLQRVKQYFKIEEVSEELYRKWLMDKMVHDQIRV